MAALDRYNEELENLPERSKTGATSSLAPGLAVRHCYKHCFKFVRQVHVRCQFLQLLFVLICSQRWASYRRSVSV